MRERVWASNAGDGGFEVVLLDVADGVFGVVPIVLDWVVIRCVGWEINQVDFLQGMALGEFVSDELVLIP